MQYNRANSCIVYLNGDYHVDLIGMNGAELPTSGMERSGTMCKGKLERNYRWTRTEREQTHLWTRAKRTWTRSLVTLTAGGTVSIIAAWD